MALANFTVLSSFDRFHTSIIF